MSDYVFRAYCDACGTEGPWFDNDAEAVAWRREHFEEDHPDNPMRKQNCRIQRYAAGLA